MREVDFKFEDIPKADDPFVILIPRFNLPGILTGAPATEKFHLMGISTYINSSKPIPTVEGKQTLLMQPLNPGIVCRSVAKMAHCAAVAELGFDAFTPLLPDIILGNSANISHLVGSTTGRTRKRDKLHEIILFIRSGYLVATVQLFARFGLQPFLVVVGMASEPLRKWHMSALITRSATPL